MKKTYFTLLAILFVFSANTHVFAQSQSRPAGLASASYNLNGFQAENGVTVKLIHRRFGGHRFGGHRFGRHGFGSHRFGGHRSHRFGYGYGGFRFNYYRPYYSPYRNYYQRPYQGYYYGGNGYLGYNNHRRHNRGHYNGHHMRHGNGGYLSFGPNY